MRAYPRSADFLMEGCDLTDEKPDASVGVYPIFAFKLRFE